MTNRMRNEQRLIEFIGQTEDGVLLSDALRYELQQGLWFGSGQTAVEVLIELRNSGDLQFDKETGKFKIPTAP